MSTPRRELTEVFSGASLEEATAAARLVHGERLTIVRATRTVSGLRGIFGHARYDVVVRLPPVAQPPPAPPAPLAPPAPGRGVDGQPLAADWGLTHRRAGRHGAPGQAEDSVGSALGDLLDRAEARERAASPDGAGSQGAGSQGAAGKGAAPSWTWSGEEEIASLMSDLSARGESSRAAERHPDPQVATHREPGPRASQPEAVRQRTGSRALPAPRSEATIEVPARPEARSGAAGSDMGMDGMDGMDGMGARGVPQPAATPGWDRGELRRLGVPAAILGRLPVEDPVDDAAWRRALRKAIETVVSPPARPSADHPVVVNGYGLLGAVAVLRAAVEEGATPGTITFEGRRRAAGPEALVEVIAECIRS